MDSEQYTLGERYTAWVRRYPDGDISHLLLCSDDQPICLLEGRALGLLCSLLASHDSDNAK